MAEGFQIDSGLADRCRQRSCKSSVALLKGTTEKARKYHPVREQLCSLTGVKIRMTPPEIPLEATPMVCVAKAVLLAPVLLEADQAAR
jgi:hypothetical protein